MDPAMDLSQQISLFVEDNILASGKTLEKDLISDIHNRYIKDNQPCTSIVVDPGDNLL